MSWEIVIVGLAVLGASAYCGRLAWRAFHGKSTGCGCGAATCHAAKPGGTPRET
ncbi:MAG: hypothetical protein HYV27_17555 [Candidatus Hydrogenedentes bacterium]|nr:hypothetical protein [Candidatus Hydrogenedentota bacterium]